MRTFVLVTGHKGAGKDTFAQILSYYLPARCFSISSYVHIALATLLGVSVDWVRLEKDREVVRVAGKEVTIRELLQRMGTEVGRYMFGPKCWLRMLFDDIESSKEQYVIVTGIRFVNEVEFFKARGHVIVCEVRRPGFEGDEHVSEKGLGESLIDLVVENDGTIEDLREKARQTARTIRRARLLELIAELEHQQWEYWSKAIANFFTTTNDIEQAFQSKLKRWKTLWVPYVQLSEEEKDADREWAERVLQAIESEVDLL